MGEKLSKKTYISVGLGQIGDSLITGLVTGYLVYFATNILGVTALAIGNVLLVSRIFDGITDLGVGVVIDRTHTKQGKARPLILRSCIPFGICTILLFSIPVNWSDTAKLIALFVMYNLYALAYTALAISKTTLTALVSKKDKERVMLTTAMVTCAIIGNIIFNVVVVQILTKLSNTTDGTFNQKGFLIFSVFLAIISIVCSLLNYFNTREMNSDATETDKKGSSIHAIVNLVKNKYWVMQTGVQFLYFIGLYCRLTAMIFFVQYVLQDMQMVAILVLADQLPGIIVTPIAAKLVMKFGKRNTLLVGNIISLLGVAIMIFNLHNIPVFLSGVIFRSIFTSPYSCTTNAFIADTAEYGKWKNGVDVSSYAFAVTSFGQKIGQGLAGGMIGYIMTLTGFNAVMSVQSITAQNGISFVYIGITGIAILLQIVILAFYNLDNKMPEINRELEEREKAMV